MDEKRFLILKAYELLDRNTPLKTDCGRLCGSLCCKGDSKTGMWLFPGEEFFFEELSGFTVLNCDGNFGYKEVVCKGVCDRKTRPLACRLYPFFPLSAAAVSTQEPISEESGRVPCFIKI